MSATESNRTLMAPPRNMVQDVENIIEGYSMGTVRALAQDPVQNSIDARRPGADIVRVEYRLVQRPLPGGEQMMLLTVTDSGTVGLRGPALSSEDLHNRAQLQLRPDENWAAWEAMGYTKIGEDALGSRGQGKAAFLYHSRHESDLTGFDGRPIDRMVILYDSLLEDGTYRLGARLARPDDVILTPPYEGDEARAIINSFWSAFDVYVPLELEPLTEVGTRVIVPFLSEEAQEAIASGELLAWLERCWWRAVQVGDVEITLIDADGTSQNVRVPQWWETEPWRKQALPEHVYVKEDIPIAPGDPLKIKRIVLLHDTELAFDEVAGYPIQYSGVQYLRGHQWIETLSASYQFGDFIPPTERDGFRGFVEFDRYLDRQLREVEKPQHDGFRRRRVFVGQIDTHVTEAVKQFAERLGWISDKPQTEPPDDATATEVMKRVAEMFVAEGRSGAGRETHWRCKLELAFPHATTTRVDYGETIGNVSIECEHRPANERKDVEFSLELVGPDGKSSEISRRAGKTINGTTGADLGDFTVVHTAQSGRELACPQGDRYRLRARCFFDGKIVASATRSFYVQTDPPPPPQARPFGVALNVENVSNERRRINNGETVTVTATITNRTTDDATLAIDLSLAHLLLADGDTVDVPGRPLGDSPGTADVVYQNINVFTEQPDETHGPYVVLEPGTHRVLIDVKSSDGNVVAHASRTIYVEVDPDNGGADNPFDVQAREDLPYPIWELEPPASEEGVWILRYAPRHPSFQAVTHTGQFAITRWWSETICTALVEWALRVYSDSGDEGAFKLMAGADGDGSPFWERYESRVQRLLNTYEDPIQCMSLQREVVSLMLCLLEES
jgi:hypothetical protein